MLLLDVILISEENAEGPFTLTALILEALILVLVVVVPVDG